MLLGENKHSSSLQQPTVETKSFVTQIRTLTHTPNSKESIERSNKSQPEAL